MEPVTLKEFITNSIIDELQQKSYTAQPQDIQEFLKAMAAISMVAEGKDDLASRYGSLYMSEYNEVKSYVLKTHIEEIEDKDLGLVRKINLN